MELAQQCFSHSPKVRKDLTDQNLQHLRPHTLPTTEVKDTLNDEREIKLNVIPAADHLFLLGDFID